MLRAGCAAGEEADQVGGSPELLERVAWGCAAGCWGIGKISY